MMALAQLAKAFAGGRLPLRFSAYDGSSAGPTDTLPAASLVWARWSSARPHLEADDPNARDPQVCVDHESAFRRLCRSHPAVACWKFKDYSLVA
jgi:hypothetical protein